MAKKKTKKKNKNNNDIFEELGIERLDVPRRQTAEELIEEVSRPTAGERAEIIKTAEAGVRRERAEVGRATLQRLKSYIEPPTRVSHSVRKLDTKVGSVVRKAVHLLAPQGMVKRITTPGKKKVKGRGRGRPRQTYKTRVLPSGKVVKVPTHIYKRMLKQEKATFRLAQAQRQAILQQQAEELAMQQDLRYRPSAEKAWVESEDMEHLADVDQYQQQLLRQQIQEQVQVQSPSVLRRAGEMFGKARITLMGGQQQQPQLLREVPSLQRPMAPPIHRPQVQSLRPSPKISLFGGGRSTLGGRNNILTQRNELF